TDEAVVQLPFIAPGRRKLFIDYWNESQRQVRSRPSPLEVIELSDLGIHPREIQLLRNEGLWDLLLQLIAGNHRPDIPPSASMEARQVLHAVSLWKRGCEAMEQGETRVALASFEEANQLIPSGKIYAIDAVLALAALGEWQEADTRLAQISSIWQG